MTTQKAPARSEFSGDRLRIVRRFAGYTLAELGDVIAVSRQHVYNLETGAKIPSPDVIDACASALGVEPGFFFSPVLDEFLEEQCHFRSRRTTPLNVRHQALAHGTMFGMVVSYLDSSLRWPHDNLPRFECQTLEDIDKIADRCRIHWGLGVDRPVESMTRLLESSGTVVSCFKGASQKVDAFSRSGRRNIAVLSTLKGSASRARYDLAHELGHLCLHAGLEPGDGQDIRREEEADRFAGSFLLPKTGFSREFPRLAVQKRIRWPELIEFKKRWMVSLAAIVRRAFNLGFIDGILYRRANISIRANRWHLGEPLDDTLPIERPEIVDLSLSQMERSFGTTAADVAEYLHLKPVTFEKVTGVKIADPVSATAESTPIQAKIHRLDHYRPKA